MLITRKTRSLRGEIIINFNKILLFKLPENDDNSYLYIFTTERFDNVSFRTHRNPE